MNERDRVSMCDVSACVSDNFPARSLYIDSYYSDSPELTTLVSFM